jgi:hypothetical protein
MTAVVTRPELRSKGSRKASDRDCTGEFSQDAVEAMIEEFARHVESLIDNRSDSSRIHFAYSRLLGTRGNICRICPLEGMDRISRSSLNRWDWAERTLRDYLACSQKIDELIATAQQVEEGWADSLERYVSTLVERLKDSDIKSQLGILKGIDAVGLHLAQREIFALSQTLAVPLENANAVKLRVRLVSLFLTLHRCGFEGAFPAIQSYRETFRIHDRLAYPWWFVDCRLTERQLNWTYRRMPVADFDWRF